MAIQTTYAMSVYGPYSITQSRDLHNYIWNKKIKKAKKKKKNKRTVTKFYTSDLNFYMFNTYDYLKHA